MDKEKITVYDVSIPESSDEKKCISACTVCPHKIGGKEKETAE